MMANLTIIAGNKKRGGKIQGVVGISGTTGLIFKEIFRGNILILGGAVLGKRKESVRVGAEGRDRSQKNKVS